MKSSVRRRRRGAAVLLALTLPAWTACEDVPEFTEPEAVTFAAVAIDKATVRPREGARLTVGATDYEVDVDIRWQGMPTGSSLGVWLETHDSVSDQTFRWEGDLLAAAEALGAASGQTSFSGTFQLPEVSPFCGSYDYVRIIAVAFPGGDEPPNEAHRDEVFYPVSGSDWTGPCVSDVFAVFAGTSFRVGEPVIVYGRNLPDALNVSLPGAQQADNVFPRFVSLPESRSLYPVPNDGYMIAFVPVGAETGVLRAFAGSGEVRYGPNGEQSLTVAAGSADVLEPNNAIGAANDSIYFDFWDPFAFWGAYGFNPSLTLSGADRTPDALAPVYGEGDWFYVYGIGGAGNEIDVCINVASHLGDLDDLDLYVYNNGGTIEVQSATASGSEGIRLDDVSGTETFWAWVTPFLAAFTSDEGGYTYEVGECAAATGTAIARPDRPAGFGTSSGQSSAIGIAAGAAASASVRMPADRDRTVPLEDLRPRGGER